MSIEKCNYITEINRLEEGRHMTNKDNSMRLKFSFYVSIQQYT